MAIINGVEQQFSEKRISKDFQKALNSAYMQRVQRVEHDEAVSQTLMKSYYPTASGQRSRKVIMPSTYATVMTGNLNQ